MRLDKFSLKWQIIGWIVVIMFSVITVSALFSILLSAEMYKEAKMQSSGEFMTELTESISGKSFSRDCIMSESWRNEVREYCESSYNSVLIQNLSTGESYSQNILPHESELDNPVFCANLLANAQSTDGNFVYADGRAGFGSIYFARLVHATDGDVVVMMNTSVRPTNSFSISLRWIFVSTSVSILIVILLLGVFITRRITKPIANITTSSKSLTEGKYSYDDSKGVGYREITEIHKSLNVAAKELSKTENLQKELIANISHDLRTPLTIISGYAEMMKDFKDADHTESIDGILNETRRMSELVNDILEMSQIESGAMYHDEVMNLTECVRSAIARFASLESQGYEVVFDADEDVYVKADEKRIMQVAYNLIANAINYGGDDKKVFVGQSVANGKVTVSVRDNGDGIPEEALKDVWQRYYKVDKEHKRASKGTGLGLAIVKGILENYTADYGVDSKVGEGSTFWFTLNIAV